MKNSLREYMKIALAGNNEERALLVDEVVKTSHHQRQRITLAKAKRIQYNAGHEAAEQIR